MTNILTKMRRTFTAIPGTDKGRLHLYASSTFTFTFESAESRGSRFNWLTQFNLERTAIPVNGLGNRQGKGLPRGLNVTEGNDLRTLGANDLHLEVPRCGTLHS